MASGSSRRRPQRLGRRLFAFARPLYPCPGSCDRYVPPNVQDGGDVTQWSLRLCSGTWTRWTDDPAEPGYSLNQAEVQDGRTWERTPLQMAFFDGAGLHRGLHRASRDGSGEQVQVVSVTENRDRMALGDALVDGRKTPASKAGPRFTGRGGRPAKLRLRAPRARRRRRSVSAGRSLGDDASGRILCGPSTARNAEPNGAVRAGS
jgi:hypothetical protein